MKNEFHQKDSLFPGITYQELMETLHANEKVIDEESVVRTFKAIMAKYSEDAEQELKMNMKRIIKDSN
jgi:uncharacterized protein YqgV (UPF0045/DUF77 family)